MAQQESLITEEMRAALGVWGPPRSTVIEAGQIWRFARAIEDPNPLWSDASYARNTPYGGIIAPPTFLCSMGYGLPAPSASGATPAAPGPGGAAGPPGGVGLNGGDEWELFEPVRPGDVITTVAAPKDIQERQGRQGRMLIRSTETVYTNQYGRVVAKHISTTITQYRQRPQG